jgi:hypothetical protein
MRTCELCAGRRPGDRFDFFFPGVHLAELLDEGWRRAEARLSRHYGPVSLVHPTPRVTPATVFAAYRDAVEEVESERSDVTDLPWDEGEVS